MKDDLADKKIKVFQNRILTWYQDHRRDLPWRKTRDPYKILVSEMMLQQTQVSRVIPKYEIWIQKFPTVESLAKARVAEVLKFWSGLGYNRRALNLKKTAEIVVHNFDRKFPEDEKLLRSLPGIGSYTSRALLCFAFDKQIAVVDTNIRKVILTQFISHTDRSVSGVEGSQKLTSKDSSTSPSTGQGSSNEGSGFARNDKVSEKEIQKIADQLLPHGRAYAWNQALMDYASAMLKEHKIPISKQSKFIGSHRYYRGQILKQLIEKKKIPVSEIGHLIKKDHEKEWVDRLLNELKKEGFIKIENKIIALAS